MRDSFTLHTPSRRSMRLLATGAAALALSAQAAGHEYAGVTCGVKEQAASRLGAAAHGPPLGTSAAIQLMQASFDKHLKGADMETQLVPESELALPATK